MTKRNIAFCVLAVLALWLLLPIIDPVPVEGFSAVIIALGEHLAKDGMVYSDQLQTFNSEFFATSKLGAVIGVALLVKALGIQGTLAMKLLMWLGEGILLAATYSLVRRWSGAAPFTAILAMLLVPGLLENSFLLTDNVPAAALTTLALVCFGRSSAVFLPLVGGILFGLGVLTRPDHLLVGIAIPLIVVDRSGFSRRSLVILVIGGMAGALTLLGALKSFNLGIVDVLHVAGYAVKLWDREPDYHAQLLNIVIFIGWPGIFLGLVGLAALMKERAYLRAAILLLPLLVVQVALRGKLWESRQLMSLSPFIVAAVAIGIQQLLPIRGAGHRDILVRAVVAIGILLVLLIPEPPLVRDGPRSLVGRVAGIVNWRLWQQSVEADLQTIRQAAIPAHPGTLALMTDQWNPDRYLHLALIEDGYRAQPQALLPVSCKRVAELFSKGDQRIVHLRIHQSFLPNAMLLDKERFETLALPCLAALSPSDMTLLTDGISAQRMVGTGSSALAAQAGSPEGASAPMPDTLAFKNPAPLTAIKLDKAGLMQVDAYYASVQQAASAMGITTPATADDAYELTRRPISRLLRAE